jgi:hypothetical protein
MTKRSSTAIVAPAQFPALTLRPTLSAPAAGVVASAQFPALTLGPMLYAAGAVAPAPFPVLAPAQPAPTQAPTEQSAPVITKATGE